MIKTKFIKLRDDAIEPTKGSKRALCYDLYAVEETVIPVGETVLVKTGLAVELPNEEGFIHELQVRPRSGLSLKNDLMVANSPGTVDEDYRGEIGVIIYNHGKNSFVVEKGMRIAQFLVTKHHEYELDMVHELTETDRGSNGFGSTGTK